MDLCDMTSVEGKGLQLLKYNSYLRQVFVFNLHRFQICIAFRKK